MMTDGLLSPLLNLFIRRSKIRGLIDDISFEVTFTGGPFVIVCVIAMD